MDLFQNIFLQVCFVNIWPEPVISDEKILRVASSFPPQHADTFTAQQCPLHSVQQLAHYMRNDFTSYKVCVVDDDLP